MSVGGHRHRVLVGLFSILGGADKHAVATNGPAHAHRPCGVLSSRRAPGAPVRVGRINTSSPRASQHFRHHALATRRHSRTHRQPGPRPDARHRQPHPRHCLAAGRPGPVRPRRGLLEGPCRFSGDDGRRDQRAVVASAAPARASRRVGPLELSRRPARTPGPDRTVCGRHHVWQPTRCAGAHRPRKDHPRPRARHRARWPAVLGQRPRPAHLGTRGRDVELPGGLSALRGCQPERRAAGSLL